MHVMLKGSSEELESIEALRNVSDMFQFETLSKPMQNSVGNSTDHYHFGWRGNIRTAFAQLEIVNALRLGERERASKMLLSLGNINGTLVADDFTYILDYCAQTPDPLFVMETWKLMEEKAIDASMQSCRCIVQAFIKGRYFKEAFSWLKYVGEHDFVHAILPLYNMFLSECSNSQSLVDAGRCLELMEDRLLGKSEITYWELLKLAVLQNNLPAVHDIWKDCTKYYSPSIITLRKFVWSFTWLNDIESAYRTLQRMVHLASRENPILRMSAAGRYQSSRIDIPIPSNHELSSEIFQLEDKALSSESPLEAEMTGKLFWSMDQSSREKQSISNTDDIFFSKTPGSRVPNDAEKDRICSPMFSSSPDCVAFDNQYPAVWQELAVSSLESLCKGWRSGKLKDVSVPVKRILRWSFNNVLHACAQCGNWELAELLFLQMHELELEPSQNTYDGFVKALIHGKGVAYGMKVIKFMEEKNIKPYNDTLAALSIGHSKNLELDTAEALLEKISDSLPKYIHPFNAFLTACDAMDQPERAVSMLARIRHLNIQPNVRTYELLFSLFGHANIPYEKGNTLSHADVGKRIKIIETDMMRSGLHHSYASIKNLIRGLGAERMIQEMLRYLNIAENMLWDILPYQRTDMYNIVLHALITAKDSHTAISIFRNMRWCGFPADVATYNIMIECCSILTCFKSACALVSMMLRDGFFPQIQTYTALTKVLLANDDFDGALCLLEEAVSAGIQLDIQLFNTTLREAFIRGRIDVMEFFLELMHREKIQPDPSTCWYTFSAYAEGGFHSTAMEALQVLSMRMISEDNRVLQEERAAFEDLVHSEDPDAEFQIVEIFKESREFVATALLNLRWCAINGVSISWLPDENPWAKRLSSSYANRKGVD